MIKNILFDIGSVLLLFDREATVREFSYYSETIPQENFTAEHVFLPEFCPGMETGEISPCEYYERFRKVSGCRVSFRHFSLIWARYFTDSRPMIALGRSLSCRFRVYFLSNTDPLHIPMLYSRFPDLLFFHGQALSYESGIKTRAVLFRASLGEIRSETIGVPFYRRSAPERGGGPYARHAFDPSFQPRANQSRNHRRVRARWNQPGILVCI